jgi:hypothetical protein
LFSIGDVQTTVDSLLSIVAVILATALIARLVRKALTNFFSGPRKNDEDSACGCGIVVQLLVWLVGVGVAYKSDLLLVRKTLEETADKLKWRSTAKNPNVFLEQFGDSGVNFAIDVWIDDANESRSRKSDLHEAV